MSIGYDRHEAIGDVSKSSNGKVERTEVRIQSTEELTRNWNMQIARKGLSVFTVIFKRAMG